MPRTDELDLPFHRPGVGGRRPRGPVHGVIGEEDRLLPIGPMERLPVASVHRVPTAHFGVHTEPWFDEVEDRPTGLVAYRRDVDRQVSGRRPQPGPQVHCWGGVIPGPVCQMASWEELKSLAGGTEGHSPVGHAIGSAIPIEPSVEIE